MALSEELPIYKEMYILLNKILDEREHFPKMYKYAFGEKLMMVCLDCLELIQAANSDMTNRRAYLQEFALVFAKLQLMLRVCRDRNIISVSAFAQILQHVGNVGRMSTGWRKSSVKPESSSPYEPR